MKIKRNVLIVLVILVLLFIIGMTVYQFMFADHSLSSPSATSGPVPTELVEPAEPIEKESVQ